MLAVTWHSPAARQDSNGCVAPGPGASPPLSVSRRGALPPCGVACARTPNRPERSVYGTGTIRRRTWATVFPALLGCAPAGADPTRSAQGVGVLSVGLATMSPSRTGREHKSHVVSGVPTITDRGWRAPPLGDPELMSSRLARPVSFCPSPSSPTPWSVRCHRANAATVGSGAARGGTPTDPRCAP